MSLSIIYSRANIGIEAPLVTVETHLSNGLPGFSIVGLPETAVKESKERVRSAILNSLLEFPAKRITVNLAPADLPKAGGRFDLAIAVGILVASGQLSSEKIAQIEFMRELALSGELRSVPGVLPGLLATNTAQREAIVPHANEAEAGLARLTAKAEVKLCKHLLELCRYLKGEFVLPQADLLEPVKRSFVDTLDDVVGQQQAQRALVLAAAGGAQFAYGGAARNGQNHVGKSITNFSACSFK